MPDMRRTIRDDLGALDVEHGVGHRTERQDLDQVVLGQAAPVRQRHPLGKGRQHSAHHHVDHQLHPRALARLAQVKGGLAHHLELGPRLLEDRLVARRQEDELALFDI